MLRKLNYLWRVFATGLAFATFGLGGLILSVFVFPLYFIFIKDQEKLRIIIRKTISSCFKSFMFYMHYLGLINFKTKNLELLQNENSCLFIANHPTLIDVVSMVAYCPNACCIVKEQLWSNFYIKRVLAAAGYIPNRDPHYLLEKCKESINRGDVLVVFPEGTRTQPGKKEKFQRAVAQISLMTKCPIRLAHISCTPLCLNKGAPWYKPAHTRPDFILKIGKKIWPTDIIADDSPRPIAARELTSYLAQEYCN